MVGCRLRRDLVFSRRSTVTRALGSHLFGENWIFYRFFNGSRLFRGFGSLRRRRVICGTRSKLSQRHSHCIVHDPVSFRAYAIEYHVLDNDAISDASREFKFRDRASGVLHSGEFSRVSNSAGIAWASADGLRASTNWPEPPFTKRCGVVSAPSIRARLQRY